MTNDDISQENKGGATTGDKYTLILQLSDPEKKKDSGKKQRSESLRYEAQSRSKSSRNDV